MNKKIILAYVIFAAIVFVSLIVWFTFRSINTRSSNVLDTAADFGRLRESIVSVYLTEDGFESPYFPSLIRTVVTADPDLRAVVIHDGRSNVYYAYALFSRYFDAPEPDATEWAGIPEYRIDPVSENRFTSPLVLPSVGTLQVDAIYQVFTREDVFPIVRELLIALLSFLLLTATILVIFPFLARREAAATEAFGGREQRVTSDLPPASQPTDGTDPGQDSPVDYSRTGQQSFTGGDNEPETSPASPRSDNRHHSDLYAPWSNLSREEHLKERLSTELKRAASFDHDLVLVLCSIPGLAKATPLYHLCADTLLEHFSFRDLCFEYGASGFASAVPNTDLDQALIKSRELRHSMDSVAAREGSNGVRIGLSARNGRIMSGGTILREAEAALRRAGSDPERIVAFRVDPERYRAFMAGQNPSTG